MVHEANKFCFVRTKVFLVSIKLLRGFYLPSLIQGVLYLIETQEKAIQQSSLDYLKVYADTDSTLLWCLEEKDPVGRFKLLLIT